MNTFSWYMRSVIGFILEWIMLLENFENKNMLNLMAKEKSEVARKIIETFMKFNSGRTKSFHFLILLTNFNFLL